MNATGHISCRAIKEEYIQAKMAQFPLSKDVKELEEMVDAIIEDKSFSGARFTCKYQIFSRRVACWIAFTAIAAHLFHVSTSKYDSLCLLRTLILKESAVAML